MINIKHILGKLALKLVKINKPDNDKDPPAKVGDFTFPPGHFYSPIPSLDQIKDRADAIWGGIPEKLSAIDLNTEEQLRYFSDFAKFYEEMPFSSEKKQNLRYYFENSSYSYSDAICLYSMIRRAKPKRIIEVGSGFSSCVMMDTNDLFFDTNIDITFIEPYPDLLFSLMRGEDRSRYRVLDEMIQNVGLEIFLELTENDILFIDSTHVSKVGSDVNTIIFDILPRVKPGVFVHFHDVCYPFEYHQEWIYQGLAWNEAYLLRAFLEYNSAFKIVFFNTYLEFFYRDKFEQHMSLCLKNPGGSIWLRKQSDTC